MGDFFQAESYGYTHKGKVRSLNEDSFLDRPDLGLWVVADGMGGHQAGDVASRRICDYLNRIEKKDSASDLYRNVTSALYYVNEDLKLYAQNTGAGMVGSTVVVLLYRGRSCACLWAGDSRLYLFRENKLYRLTKDHTTVQELINAGLLAPEDAENHPRANEITRAVGAENELQLEPWQGSVGENDIFLLCTDGITKSISENDIEQTVRYYGNPKEIVLSLIETGLECGAPDNLTALAVKMTKKNTTASMETVLDVASPTHTL